MIELRLDLSNDGIDGQTGSIRQVQRVGNHRLVAKPLRNGLAFRGLGGGLVNLPGVRWTRKGDCHKIWVK
jgi:hypothetical protein